MQSTSPLLAARINALSKCVKQCAHKTLTGLSEQRDVDFPFVCLHLKGGLDVQGPGEAIKGW